MPGENLFDNNSNLPKPPDNSGTPQAPLIPDQGNLFVDQLASIKNTEGKPKYDSVPKALDALNHSQEHILNLTTSNKTLEAENEALKLEAAKHESVEDVVARLTAQSNDQVPVTPQPTVVDPAEINKLVQIALDSNQANQTRQGNKDSVISHLNKTYGDKAREVIEAKAMELGTTPENLGRLSEDNPQLVLALFAEEGAKPANPTSSSVTIPMGDPNKKELEKPAKSLLQGASSADQADYMRKIRDEVYAKHGVTAD